jgi:DNA-binding beta-propeller fold protein YncE
MRSSFGSGRLVAAVLCAGLTLCSIPAAAQGEPGDPLFQYFGVEAKDGSAFKPFPPGSGFEGPCGLAVDSRGDFYVADYYHHAVDAISSTRHYLDQMAGEDPADGPCGLAVDAAGDLYVDNYHRDVVRYAPSAFPPASSASYGPGTVIDSGRPTGVAVAPASGRVYVDDRTYIAVYEASGAPVEVGGEPLRIGEGTLEDGYGLAFSQFPGSEGRLYVADAATDTVKAYDPEVDTVDPVQEIDGHELPSGGFVSLRDSALAVDRLDGQVYVADLLQPEGYERPEAAIYAFEASGVYAGRLERNVIDARPPGLAVDASATSSAGRVYVTTGNSEGASVYAYRSGEASKSPPVCASEGSCPGGSKAAALAAGGLSAALASAGPPAPARAAAATSSEIAQKGTLRVSVSAAMTPHSLPRTGSAPIAVSIAGAISTTDETEPPRLKGIRIELNRHGHLDATGIPTCPYDRIQPASSARALSACRSALVGKGHFQANIGLSGQAPYPTEGKLLVFNGARHGKPVLYGQIYSPHPFATSFVIVFAVSRISHGAFGTALVASLPKALGSWGYLTGIEMRLSRRYSFKGNRRSFLSAGCPAPRGFTKAVFPLARTGFSFAGRPSLETNVSDICLSRG